MKPEQPAGKLKCVVVNFLFVQVHYTPPKEVPYWPTLIAWLGLHDSGVRLFLLPHIIVERHWTEEQLTRVQYHPLTGQAHIHAKPAEGDGQRLV